MLKWSFCFNFNFNLINILILAWRYISLFVVLFYDFLPFHHRRWINCLSHFSSRWWNKCRNIFYWRWIFFTCLPVTLIEGHFFLSFLQRVTVKFGYELGLIVVIITLKFVSSPVCVWYVHRNILNIIIFLIPLIPHWYSVNAITNQPMFTIKWEIMCWS